MMLPERPSTVRESVITCIEAPRLKGISIKGFIEFKRKSDTYERQIEKKSRQIKEALIPTSLNAFIEDEDHQIFILAGWLETLSVDETAERQIKECVDETCKQKVNGEHLYLIDEAVRRVNMRMHIMEAVKIVWTVRREYGNALRSVGFGDLHIHKPHIPIDYFLRKLKPYALHRRMLDIVKWGKNESFDKEDLDRFVRGTAT